MFNKKQLSELTKKNSSTEFAIKLSNKGYLGPEISELIQKYYKKDLDNPTGPWINR